MTSFTANSPAINSPPKASYPIPGHSLGNIISTRREGLRRLISFLETNNMADTSRVDLFSKTTIYGIEPTIEDSKKRTAWLVAFAYIGYSLCIGLSQGDESSQALDWFFTGTGIQHQSIFTLKQAAYPALLDHLSAIKIDEDFIELLPFLSEPYGHITRSLLEQSEHAKDIRSQKKAAGVFYTPSDVVEFIVSGTANDIKGNECWLDPAAGTGLFLRSILRTLFRHAESGRNKFSELLQNITGLEKSSLSADICAHILSIEYWRLDPNHQCNYRSWYEAKQRLICSDALQLLDTFSDISTTFSHHFPERGFNYIVMNPPYGRDKRINGFPRKESICNPPCTSTLDVHVCFLSSCLEALSPDGHLGAILPLSIGSSTSTPYKNLRRQIASINGAKQFLFFDREPQALFGEDIKTRNVIFFLNKSEQEQVLTSSLLKWRQINRPMIFTKNRGTSLRDISYDVFIPKLSDSRCASAYKKVILKVQSCPPIIKKADLQKLIEEYSSSEKERMLIVAPTAYNFINSFPLAGIAQYDISSYSKSPQFALRVESPQKVYQIYAVAVSSISYWLWHVVSDGFHLTTSYLRNLAFSEMNYPIDHIDDLQQLGQLVWEKAKNRPTQSINGGRRTISFHISYRDSLIEEIDRRICDAYSINRKEYNAIINFIDTVTTSSVKRSSRS